MIGHIYNKVRGGSFLTYLLLHLEAIKRELSFLHLNPATPCTVLNLPLPRSILRMN